MDDETTTGSSVIDSLLSVESPPPPFRVSSPTSNLPSELENLSNPCLSFADKMLAESPTTTPTVSPTPSSKQISAMPGVSITSPTTPSNPPCRSRRVHSSSPFVPSSILHPDFSTPLSSIQQRMSVAPLSGLPWQHGSNSPPINSRFRTGDMLGLPSGSTAVVLRDAIQRLTFQCRPQLAKVLAFESKGRSSFSSSASSQCLSEKTRRGETQATAIAEAATASETARAALISVSALLELLVPTASSLRSAPPVTAGNYWDQSFSSGCFMPSSQVNSRPTKVSVLPSSIDAPTAATGASESRTGVHCAPGEHEATISSDATVCEANFAQARPSHAANDIEALNSYAHNQSGFYPFGSAGYYDTAGYVNRGPRGNEEHEYEFSGETPLNLQVDDLARRRCLLNCRSLHSASALLHHMIKTQDTIEATVAASSATAASTSSNAAHTAHPCSMNVGGSCNGGGWCARGNAGDKRKASGIAVAPNKQCKKQSANCRPHENIEEEVSGESTAAGSTTSNKMSSDCSSAAASSGRGSSARKTANNQCKDSGFESIIGGDVAKTALQVNVVLPLTLGRHVFRGLRSCGHVLLFGPPGTGKTSLAKAAACEAGAFFIPVPPSAFLSKYQGESERAIQKLFTDAKARTTQPTVIFFDEVDSLVPSRTGGGEVDLQGRRVLSELLVQLSALDDNSGDEEEEEKVEVRAEEKEENEKEDKNEENVVPTNEGKSDGSTCTITGGSSAAAVVSSTAAIKSSETTILKAIAKQKRQPVVVMGATNLLGDIDPALLRRFHSRVLVALPSVSERVAMLSYFLRTVAHMLTPDELEAFGRRTEGWSGSDLQLLCRDAAMRPLRKMFDSSNSSSSSSQVDSIPPISVNDLDGAFEALAPTVTGNTNLSDTLSRPSATNKLPDTTDAQTESEVGSRHVSKDLRQPQDDDQSENKKSSTSNTDGNLNKQEVGLVDNTKPLEFNGNTIDNPSGNQSDEFDSNRDGVIRNASDQASGTTSNKSVSSLPLKSPPGIKNEPQTLPITPPLLQQPSQLTQDIYLHHHHLPNDLGTDVEQEHKELEMENRKIAPHSKTDAGSSPVPVLESPFPIVDTELHGEQLTPYFTAVSSKNMVQGENKELSMHEKEAQLVIPEIKSSISVSTKTNETSQDSSQDSITNGTPSALMMLPPPPRVPPVTSSSVPSVPSSAPPHAIIPLVLPVRRWKPPSTREPTLTESVLVTVADPEDSSLTAGPVRRWG